MIYLDLFLTFLQIGAVSFGGGYGMISMIRDQVLAHGWLAESELLNMIAVSESTPGPIAVNIATFVGSDQGGMLGAALATLGVILPSFLIILLIAALITNLLKYAGVKAFLGGIRPCVVGLILSTAITIGANTLFSFSKIGDMPDVDIGGVLIFAVICGVAALFRLVLKKRPSPILMIVISAGLGMLVYSFV